MSRVEDDRDQARIAARLAETKRAEETKKSERAVADSAFSKLVGKQKEGAAQAQKDTSARSAIAHLIEQSEAGGAESARAADQGAQHAQGENAFKSRLGGKALQEKVHGESRAGSEHGQSKKLESDQGQATVANERAADQGAGAGRSEGRRGDAKTTRERVEERKGSSDSAASGKAGGARGEKGDLKADADKGGGQQGGGNNQKDSPAMQPSFRFNPGLMAPVPVAKQKEASGSDRLRKVANEIAQKIVERVRVGTNSAGRVEMQIDLRNDVLSGLTVKVSSHQGKIKAVFSGSDREVLKMLEEQSEALKAALTARGLTLEDLKIEARP